MSPVLLPLVDKMVSAELKVESRFRKAYLCAIIDDIIDFNDISTLLFKDFINQICRYMHQIGKDTKRKL